MAAVGAQITASPFLYARRRSRVVRVGDKFIGGEHPILVQSMCTTETLDTEATVAQCLRMAQAGCELLRITAPTPKHAANLKAIRAALNLQGCRLPIVADIHFMPEAAMEAALHIEKVRINPGNYADTKRFAVKEYSDAQYADELMRLEERFAPLVKRCQQLGRAMRIGTNHGSLSDRIMNRFGDSPQGMVESALEFLRIAGRMGYHEMVLSMKSSNPKVMVQAYRLLAVRLEAEGMDYPLHLGVTEAGDGEDGRIKSMAGMATLLEDGLGDTVRVSLTEDPEFEMPVAFQISRRYPSQPTASRAFEAGGNEALARVWRQGHPLTEYARRNGGECKFAEMNLHHRSLVRVFTIAPLPSLQWEANLAWMRSYDRGPNERLIRPEVMFFDVSSTAENEAINRFAAEAWKLRVPTVARFDLGTALDLATASTAAMCALRLPSGSLPQALQNGLATLVQGVTDRKQALLLEFPQSNWADLEAGLGSALSVVEGLGPENVIVSLRGSQPSQLIHLGRAAVAWMDGRHRKYPLLLDLVSSESPEELMLSASTFFGSMLLDGVGDAVMVETTSAGVDTVGLCFNILQAAGVRISKTEFISCPSCGRTLFDLQEVTARIKGRTGHLVGVKIAIMGCIVNGPGEMADADFGYVGGAPGLINLYVGKTCVEKGIPMERADGRLVELIKENGKWTEQALA